MIKLKRKFQAGDRYRPIVHIEKVKNDLPTVIKVSGNRYILQHKDQFTWKNKKK